MKQFFVKHWANIVFGVTISAFTAYALLDTFVIPRRYSVAATETVAQAATEDDSDATEKDTTKNNTGDASESTEKESNNSSEKTKNDSESSSEDSSASEKKHSRHGEFGSRKHKPSFDDFDKSNDSGESSEASSESKELQESMFSGETLTYSDDDTSINIKSYRQNDTTIYVADVVTSEADALKTAFAENAYGKNIKAETSEIASENNAVLAINGDFYGARNSGYVIRDGVLYRNTSAGNEDLVIYSDGSFGVINEDEITAEELVENGAKQVFSFGPALVENGAISVTSEDEVGKAKADNPRTAIGIIDEGHYVLVVSDGRTDESTGLSLLELAEFMKDLGVTCAYNLDGGGSSTMVFNGTIVNNPTTNGNSISERSVSDIVFIS